ncbi:MAG TPA: prepilin-type N-terminal cleavage/methylation domain-containing protein [Planctomycetota bacterium]|nr:prepilin-type N-terminal cleavage/methylation domain-containing protein [Planctomycetota bacterium]
MRKKAGITLVELMVAMALMTVLTGTIIFIFSQAQAIYAAVDAKVKVYQYARTALDTMEQDLANVVASPDMDFFNDIVSKNGHYDPGEELGNGVGIDGTEEKQLGLPCPVYHYGFTLRQPKYYANPLFKDSGRLHSHDSIYFKTVTQSNGSTVVSLIEYAMVDMLKERPKLVKRMWVNTGADPNTNKLTINGPPVGTNNGTQTTPITQDLCLYVTDVQFQIFVQDNRYGGQPTDVYVPGTYYGAQDLVDAKISQVTGAPPFPAFRNFWRGLQFKPPGQDDYMVQCYYDPSHSGGTDQGQFDKSDNGLFHTQNNFDFPMLAAGDRIYIFDISPGALTNAGIQPNDYTIKGWPKGAGVGPGRIQFNETISTTGPNFPGTSLNVAYRAGWVPPAIRVVLKIKDEKAKEIRTISRVFKVLSSG